MPKVTVPEDFLCPITCELMTDPVATADGQIYERQAIEKWLQGHDTSPLTNAKLEHKKLTVIPFVKKQIQAYLEKAKICTSQEFLEAVARGNVQRLEALNYLESYLEARDKDGRTPLLWAARDGQAEIVQLLLAAKANTEAIDKEDGDTPLICAVQDGQAEIVQLLLAAKANIEATDEYGDTPLLWAAKNGRTEIVQLLLAAKANTEAADKNGYTPLSWAAAWGCKETAKVLLEYGADYKALSKNNKTPRDIAIQNGQLEAAKFIVDYHQKLKAEIKQAPREIAELKAMIKQQQQLIEQLMQQLHVTAFQSNTSQAELMQRFSSVYQSSKSATNDDSPSSQPLSPLNNNNCPS